MCTHCIYLIHARKDTHQDKLQCASKSREDEDCFLAALEVSQHSLVSVPALHFYTLVYYDFSLSISTSLTLTILHSALSI